MKTRSPLIDGLLSLLDGTAAAGARKITCVDDRGQEEAIEYGELARRALAVCAGLRELGARKDDLVLLALPGAVDYAALLQGCVLAGVLPCTVRPAGNPASNQNIAAVCRLYQPRLVFAQDAAVEALAACVAPTGVRVVGMSTLARACAAGASVGVCNRAETDAHHVQLTSGSVSNPKAAILSHRSVVDNCRGIGGAVGYDPARRDSTVLWLPLHHDMGLVTLLASVMYQGTLLIMQPAAFIRNPLGWLKRMAAAQATTTAAPTFALRYCVRRFRAAAMAGVDLGACRNIFIGAERVDERTLLEFARTFAPYGLRGSALQPCYGMAESTLAVTMHDASLEEPVEALAHMHADRIDADMLAQCQQALPAPALAGTGARSGLAARAEVVLSVGRPIPGMACVVRDAAGQPAAERQAGEILIRGTSVMTGYLPSAGVPVPPPWDADGWLATGDIGYVADGRLHILGRRKEIIILRGVNYVPHEIEDVVAEHPAVHKSGCAAVGVHDEEQGTENLVLLVEAARPDAAAQARAEMQALLQRTLGHCAQDIVFVEAGALPRTSSGKLQRLKAREMYLGGEFALTRPAPEARADAPPTAPAGQAGRQDVALT